MTKKHFEVLAARIRFLNLFVFVDDETEQEIKKIVAKEIAAALSELNECFDKAGFIAAATKPIPSCDRPLGYK